MLEEVWCVFKLSWLLLLVRHKKVLCMHAIDDEMRESIAAV
jgi:hypothetical protein